MPNNAVLVIVGNVQQEKALAQVKEIFGAISSAPLPTRPHYNFSPVKPDTLKLNTDLPYGLTAVVFRFPGAENPDFAVAQILSDVLSSQRGTLYDLVPQGKALFAEFEYETLQKSGLGYAIAGFPAGADSTNLLNQVKEILAAEITNGVSAELVEAAKRREIMSAELSKNSVSGLASAWSQAVAVENRNSPDDDIALYRKVTVDDVNRVARKYLDFDHAIGAILTPQPSDKPISSKSFGGKENFASSKNSNVKLPDWAKKLTAQLPAPASTLNPFTTNLPNGIKLIVQPETVSDTVSVLGRIKHKCAPARMAWTRRSTNYFPTAPNRSTAWRSKKRSTTSVPTNPPARIFRCKCCQNILTAACNCSPTTNFRPRCRKTISKSSSRSSPRRSPANCKALTTSPATN